MFRRSSETKADSRHDDVTVFEPVKMLGIFALQEVDTHTKDGKLLASLYRKAGVVDDMTKSFIDLHLRPDISADVGPQAVRESLTLAADYIAAHPDRFAGQDIIGVTYPRMGKVAERFGFQNAAIRGNRFPQDVAEKLTQMANEHGYDIDIEPTPETFVFSTQAMFGNFSALHQTTDELIARYGSHDSNSPA
jgi:hypothetical protein